MSAALLHLLRLLVCLAATAAAHAQPVAVAVRKAGETIFVDVTARVLSNPGPAWAALTDYDHMAEFVSAVRESRVVSRQGNFLEVAQTGGAKRGFFDFTFKTLRSVELVPESEIRSRLIHGDFKSYEFTTRLAVDSSAGAVTITHHGEYVPNIWVPPVVGPALIEAETRKQYGDLITEILRRQAGGEPRGNRPAPGASSP